MSTPQTADVPLTAAPDAALLFALGYAVTRPVSADRYGGIAAVCDELTRRGVFAGLIASLPVEIARAVQMLYTADRGQQWARTGRQPAPILPPVEMSRKQQRLVSHETLHSLAINNYQPCPECGGMSVESTSVPVDLPDEGA